MKQTKIIMGMPVTIDIRDTGAETADIEKIFGYFESIDKRYSPYKNTSEVAKFNRGEKVSVEMKKILKMAMSLKKKTKGYFDIVKKDGSIDPSGIVKGWAIKNAAKILHKLGYSHFYIDAGGDAEIRGKFKWGIRNPFKKDELVKTLILKNCGIATSGTYERGQHIYLPAGAAKQALQEGNPINDLTDIVSITVIGPDVYEADKYSTPAFAMGRRGIHFIESVPGLEGYMIDRNGLATYTSGFNKFTL